MIGAIHIPNCIRIETICPISLKKTFIELVIYIIPSDNIDNANEKYNSIKDLILIGIFAIINTKNIIATKQI